MINVKDYGAIGDGTTDDTVSIQNAINSAGQNNKVYFPTGNYRITNTITVYNHRIHLCGDGAYATKLYFNPSADGSLLIFNAGTNVIFQNSIKDIALWGDSSSYNKVALDIVDASGFTLRDVVIGGDYIVASVGGFFGGGSNSIGIKIRGREFGIIDNLYCYADSPIYIGNNPNDSIDIDHWDFRDCYLTANNHPNVTIESGVNLTQVNFNGKQAWVRGTSGLQWIDTTSNQVSNGLHIENVRTENGTDSNGFAFDIQHNYGLQNLTINKCHIGPERNGFRLRKIIMTELSNSFYLGSTGKTALDSDSTVDRLSFRQMWWNSGCSSSVNGQRVIFATQIPSLSIPLPSEAIYDKSTNGIGNITLEGAVFSEEFTLQNNTSVSLAPFPSSGMVFIQDSEGLGAIYNLRGAYTAVSEVSDPVGVYTSIQGSNGYTNIYWSSINNRYEIENRRGSQRRYRTFFIGSYTSFS